MLNIRNGGTGSVSPRLRRDVPAGARLRSEATGHSPGMGAKLGWRIFGGLAAVLAALVARKALTAGWTKTVGDEPPSNPEDPDTTWMEALGWAVLSGAVMGLARLLATRKAAAFWRRSTGHLPPGIEKVT